MEHISLDEDGPTSGEGGVKTTTTPPNKGGGDVTEEMRTVKKARKERKKARKEKRAREVAGATKETPAALVPSTTSPPAGLRRATSKFLSPLKSLKFDKYSHTFKREHATASVILSADEKYNELTMKIRMLVSQAQKVDTTFVIEPAKEGNKSGRWEKSSEVPFNFTELGAAVKIADNARFEKVKPWGKKPPTKMALTLS